MKRFFLCPLLLVLCSQPASAILDSNNNGMSDVSERIYNYGNLFPSSFHPQDDEDSDGWTNAEEAVAGTDPNSSTSPDGMVRPEVAIIHDVSLDLDNDGISESYVEVAAISWPIVAGKQYTLFHSPDMSEGSWTLVQQATATFDGTRTSYFPVATSEDKMFWRIEIEDIDSDGDGLTDAEEYKLGTDPYSGQTIADITDFWLAKYFTNILLAGGPNMIDPNADPNNDGYTIVQEAYQNFDPSTSNTPNTGPIGQGSIVNGDFSQPGFSTGLRTGVTTPSWNYWGTGGVPGWSAVAGTNIELQKITPKDTGNPYVELKAHPAGHRGIKQEVGTHVGASYLLMLDCRDRADVAASCSNFNVVIGTEIKCKISFTDSTGSDQLTKYIAPGEWNTVAVPFTASNPTTWISLVPVNSVDDTTGCLVDNVRLAKFKLRDDADFIKGWDDTGKEPWTSVGVGKTNSIVKFIGGTGEYELVVDPVSTSYLSISNETVTEGDTSFDITGIADSKNAGAGGAKIILRKKGTVDKLAILHVHVLPERNVHFTVNHASDEGPGRVPLSAIPANAPSPATIQTELNETFLAQTNISFIANLVSNPTIVSNCDGSFATDGACYYGSAARNHGSLLVEDWIVSRIYAKDRELGINVANLLNIVIVNNVIRNNPRKDVDGITGEGIRFPFVDANANIQTFAHETGHSLNLSSRTDPSGNHHDPGPDPQGNTPIMGVRLVGKPRSHWLRQEEWRIANDYAGENYH